MEYELNKWDIFTISTGFSGFFFNQQKHNSLGIWSCWKFTFSTTSEAWYPIVIEGTILHGCEIYYGGQVFSRRGGSTDSCCRNGPCVAWKFGNKMRQMFEFQPKVASATRNVDWRCGDLFLLLAVEGFWMCPGWSIKCLHWLVQLLVSFSLQKANGQAQQ